MFLTIWELPRKRWEFLFWKLQVTISSFKKSWHWESVLFYTTLLTNDHLRSCSEGRILFHVFYEHRSKKDICTRRIMY
jgi:hypothetical protein